jgi:hypothetical protein
MNKLSTKIEQAGLQAEAVMERAGHIVAILNYMGNDSRWGKSLHSDMKDLLDAVKQLKRDVKALNIIEEEQQA